jgi:hypothetical protein
MLRKPELILARDDEWRTLAQFVTQPVAQLRIAVLSGRRRVGKSYLLRELSRAVDGLYVTAVAEEDGVAARQRFAADFWWISRPCTDTPIQSSNPPRVEQELREAHEQTLSRYAD